MDPAPRRWTGLSGMAKGWRDLRALVAVASKHGATQAIAEAIARSLASAGIDAEAKRIDDVTDPSHYDAVVLGSAV